MLAVARSARGRGVGEALVRACVERARATRGRAGAWCSPPSAAWHGAHRIYARLGFVRTPERDWTPIAGPDTPAARSLWSSVATATRHNMWGVPRKARPHMYAHARCRRRGIRCESGTVPQRCDVGALCRTAPVRGPADSAPGSTDPGARRPGLADWAGGRRARAALPAPACRRSPSPAGPEPSEGEPPVTIAPADPASATPSGPRRADGPGTTLLRTLTELTADLPDTDPGRVAAAALRGRNAAVGRGRAARAGHRGGRRSDLRGPRVLPARRPAADPHHRRRGRRRRAPSSFSASVAVGPPRGPDRRPHRRVRTAARGPAGRPGRRSRRRDDRFGYFGLRTLYSRYLLRHPITRQVIETPQHFMLRVACGLAEDDSRARRWTRSPRCTG